MYNRNYQREYLSRTLRHVSDYVAQNHSFIDVQYRRLRNTDRYFGLQIKSLVKGLPIDTVTVTPIDLNGFGKVMIEVYGRQFSKVFIVPMYKAARFEDSLHYLIEVFLLKWIGYAWDNYLNYQVRRDSMTSTFYKSIATIQNHALNYDWIAVD